ncbi:MAG: hypothetical protein K2X35_05255 [Bryobacteraceae bacterium]|nr:hypothetical protein [Bryobacteraceae bacterium]
MMLTALTLSHVLISLAGILLGLVIANRMIAGRIDRRPNDWFLGATLATNVSGFFFPVQEFLPSHAIGIVSLVVLGFAGAAIWRHRLRGAWLKTYVVTSIIALYLNVFVLVVQLFRHVPILHRLAPSESEPPFQLAQLATLVAFVAIGIFSVKGVKKMMPDAGLAPVAAA